MNEPPKFYIFSRVFTYSLLYYGLINLQFQILNHYMNLTFIQFCHAVPIRNIIVSFLKETEMCHRGCCVIAP